MLKLIIEDNLFFEITFKHDSRLKKNGVSSEKGSVLSSEKSSVLASDGMIDAIKKNPKIMATPQQSNCHRVFSTPDYWENYCQSVTGAWV